MHGKHDVPMYDYIQNRLEKDKAERRHKPVFELEIPQAKLTEEDMAAQTKRKLEQSYM